MPHDGADEKTGNKMWENWRENAKEIFPHFIPTSKNNAYFYI